MRILVVTPLLPYLPCHGSDRLTVSHLVAHLGERHQVGVLAVTMPGDTPSQRSWLTGRAAWVKTLPARRWRHAVSGRPAEMLTALGASLQQAVRAFRPEVVHLESGLLAPLAADAGVPVVLACHESAALHARDARRRARSPWSRLLAAGRERRERAWERRWFAAASACVVDAEEDRQALAAQVAFDRVDVIPLGIDPVQYAFRRGGDPSRLVFSGQLDTARDAEAARRLATGILPLVRRSVPRATLLLAGPHPTPAVRALSALPGVRVEGGTVDLRPSLWSSAVYVSPLDTGSGRKARILEALALGTPVVASSASLSGLSEALPGHHALVADLDAEIAEAVTLLLREPVVANTVARNARELVERRLTWRAVHQRYEAVYRRFAPARLAVAA